MIEAVHFINYSYAKTHVNNPKDKVFKITFGVFPLAHS